MRSRTTLMLLAIIVLVAGGYAVYRLTRPPLSDPEQIQKLILTSAGFLEQHRVRSFMAALADDYNDGTYTKQDVENLIRGAVLQAGELRIVPYLPALQVHGTTADVTIEAQVTVGRAAPGGTADEPLTGRYTIQATLRKGPQGWQVTSAKGWEGAQHELGN